MYVSQYIYLVGWGSGSYLANEKKSSLFLSHFPSKWRFLTSNKINTCKTDEKDEHL